MKNLCHKILLIEDDAADAGLICDMVESKEAECVVATTDRLSSALELLRESTFEVVLLDLALPDSKGLETLRRLQDEGPPLPIVVLTVTDDEELAAEAISMGAQDYLVKARFDADQLYRSMIYAMERKRYEQQLRESEEKYRELVENANSIVIRMDRKGAITFFNEYAQTLFGYSRDEIIGRDVKILIPKTETGSGRDLEKMIDNILSNPDDVYRKRQRERRVTTENGSGSPGGTGRSGMQRVTSSVILRSDRTSPSANNWRRALISSPAPSKR